MNQIKFKIDVSVHREKLHDDSIKEEKIACLYMTTGDFDETNTYNCSFYLSESVEETLSFFEAALNSMFDGYNQAVDGKLIYTKLRFELIKVKEDN